MAVDVWGFGVMHKEILVGGFTNGSPYTEEGEEVRWNARGWGSSDGGNDDSVAVMDSWSVQFAVV